MATVNRALSLTDLPAPPEGKTGWPWTKQSELLDNQVIDNSEWPYVSIITPSYNQGAFIENAIRSVLLQGYPNLEYIIIDGGSTDETIEILKKYDPWITYWVSEPDRGQSHAMNKGIEMARSEIISFLNTDDFYQPNIFSTVLEKFQSLPNPSLLVGDCNVLREGDLLDFVNKPKNLSIQELLKGNGVYPINPSSYFYHKSLHNSIGMYSENLYMMDIDFILSAVTNAYTEYIPSTLGNYRVIPGTKTSTTEADGSFKAHANQVWRKHMQSLPIHQKIEVSLHVKKRALLHKIRSYFNQ